MDSNYEAQRQLGRQRMAALQQQAASERLLRSARPSRTGRARQFFTRLLRRGKRGRRPEQQPVPSLAGPDRR